MDDYPTPDLADVQLVDLLRALSDPVRLQIVQVLQDGRPHGKGSTAWGVELQKSTLSHHFRTLREAGLTETIVDGRTHTIRLRRQELDRRFPGLIAALIAAEADPRVSR